MKDAALTNPMFLDARLFLLSDGFVYAASAVSSVSTRRHAGVLLISLDETPLSVRFTGEGQFPVTTLKGRAIALAPGVDRTLKVGPAGALSVHFEPTHPAFLILARNLRKTGGRVIPDEFFGAIEDDLRACQKDNCTDSVVRVFEYCARAVAALSPAPVERDPRITRLLDQLQATSPIDYEFEEVLESCNLSASRVSHLFTSQAGLSLRSFLQWRKIREAITMFETGSSMTEIAHASGFSDSAHFCRTFNASLGLRPSLFGPGREVNVRVLDRRPSMEWRA